MVSNVNVHGIVEVLFADSTDLKSCFPPPVAGRFAGCWTSEFDPWASWGSLPPGFGFLNPSDSDLLPCALVFIGCLVTRFLWYSAELCRTLRHVVLVVLEFIGL